jgi:hypothetical protein
MIEILVPTSWDDVTVDTYSRLKTIDPSNYDTLLQHTQAVIKCLCNIEDIGFITNKSLGDIANEITFVNEPITEEVVDDIRAGGKLFRWKGNLNQITLGEMLSIEQIIDIEQLSYQSSVDVVAAVLLREVDKDGKLMDFDSDKFKEYRELFSQLPITHFNGMMSFFLRGGQISTGLTPLYSVKMLGRRTTIQKRSSKLRRLLGRLRKLTPFLNG